MPTRTANAADGGTSKINVELLAKVRDKILATPSAYDQQVFYRQVSEDVAPCGTQACIAGWTVLLSGINRTCARPSCLNPNCMSDAGDVAASLLGLNFGDAATLFSASARGSWPTPFGDRYAVAETPAERARAAADYLQHIIETGKVTE